MKSIKSPSKYIALLFTSFLLFIGYILSLNYMYDPWWYFDGNKVDGYKFTFNDREAKLNKFHYDSIQYDCLYLASSRGLSFDELAIPGHKCVNFAISNAGLGVNLSYAAYFQKYFPNPKLIIVAMEERIFRAGGGCVHPRTHKVYKTIPSRPAPWYKTYFSIEALRFSKRLAAKHRIVIGRDSNWKPMISEPRNSTGYNFSRLWNISRDIFNSYNNSTKKKKIMNPECLAVLQELKEMFPKTKFIGYVTPITPDLVTNLIASGELPSFLSIMHDASGYFDAFYDFTYPNTITLNPANTWDGTHFKPKVSHQIIDTLFNGKDLGALNVKKLSYLEYYEYYLKTLVPLVFYYDLDPEHKSLNYLGVQPRSY